MDLEGNITTISMLDDIHHRLLEDQKQVPSPIHRQLNLLEILRDAIDTECTAGKVEELIPKIFSSAMPNRMPCCHRG